MRYLLHPFQLTILAISVALAPSSTVLIMVSDPEDDHPVYAAGWIGILAVAVLVVILVTGTSPRAARDPRDEIMDELMDELRELVKLEMRRIKADLRQITTRDETDRYSSHHLN